MFLPTCQAAFCQFAKLERLIWEVGLETEGMFGAGDIAKTCGWLAGYLQSCITRNGRELFTHLPPLVVRKVCPPQHLKFKALGWTVM